MFKKKEIFFLILIFVFVLLFYYPALFTYFSQDDFFHFKVSLTDGSFLSYINFFKFHPFSEREIAFYRPIFREVVFSSFYQAFGLNPYPFRIFQILIHFTNIILVYTLMQILFKNKFISLLTSFFFGFTASHIASLYYLAGGIQSLGVTLCMLLTIILFDQYLKKEEAKFLIFSLLTFLLALASHELAASLPILLAIIVYTYKSSKKPFWKIKPIFPFLIITILYIYFDITIIGFSSHEQQYQPIINPKTLINSLAWYSAWALGLPEMLIDFVLPGFKLNPNLMHYWGRFYSIILPSFFIAIILIVSFTFFLLRNTPKVLKNRKLLFLLFWFPIVLFPVVILPWHKSTYYLEPALPAFWGTISFIAINTYKLLKKTHPLFASILISGFIVNLFILSATSILLENNTYWAVNRGRSAEILIHDIKIVYPTLPKGARIYYKNDPSYPYIAQDWGGSSKQANIILNGSDALRLVYNDPTIEVFYEDLIKNEGLMDSKIIILTAKLN